MKKKLKQYKGRLSPAQIAAGMNAAARNACRLAEDAETMLVAKRYATAASLAILSIEEAGKVSILRVLALARSQPEADEAWKEYRSHTRKNVAWILPQLIADGARKLDDLHPLYDKESEHPFILDQIKQIGFYTDCLGKAHWSVPMEIIEEPLARMLVQTARLFARDREFTEKEIELWCQHMGPAWKRNPEWMRQAIINWYAAMQEAGLAPEGIAEINEFMEFMGSD